MHWKANDSSGILGTTVSLHLKPEAKDFLETDTVRNLIKKYSQFINFPIYMWASHTEKVEEPAEVDEKPVEDEEKPAEDKIEDATEDEAAVEEEKEDKEEKPKTKEVSSHWIFVNICYLKSVFF